MDIFFTSEGLISLLTLTFLEIVLGVDNIIFISIVSNKLPKHQQAKARNIGLIMALGFRIALLFGISFIIGLTAPLFVVWDYAISGRDLVLVLGGLFLLAKSTSEIHEKMEGESHEAGSTKIATTLSKTIVQIVLLDIVFSFDSILTAVGLSDHLSIMITAVVISLVVMMVFAGRIAAFINNHPTLQILALSFLILIGFMLILDGLGQHVPKGYIYFAVAFSLAVEVINLRMKKKNKQ
ncbi:MAG: putative tellurium resistance membrane protein TerC [Flavobacteriales bacterium]|jgi:predicted tellurium resistance membrane protein TerC